MPLSVAIWVVRCITAYAIIGFAFALVFVRFGVQRIDPHAKDSGWGFRAMILPGSMLLWPLLAYRWVWGITEPPTETNAHRSGAHAHRSNRSDRD